MPVESGVLCEHEHPKGLSLTRRNAAIHSSSINSNLKCLVLPFQARAHPRLYNARNTKLQNLSQVHSLNPEFVWSKMIRSAGVQAGSEIGGS
jgi:hypothetical protein